jgi:hypothetical protein
LSQESQRSAQLEKAATAVESDRLFAAAIANNGQNDK